MRNSPTPQAKSTYRAAVERAMKVQRAKRLALTATQGYIRSQTSLEEKLARRIEGAGLPKPVREFYAVPGRKFRWDFAWPEFRLLCEVQGVRGSDGHEGAHRGITGFTRDCEKQSLAAAHGWRVVVVTGAQATSGKAVSWIAQAIQAGPPKP